MVHIEMHEHDIVSVVDAWPVGYGAVRIAYPISS
jgi:hypothetical protein